MSALNALAILISVASLILSVAAWRRQNRAYVVWSDPMEMADDYEPPSASLNPDAQP